MAKLDDQISTLQAKLSLLKLRQQRIDARHRAIAADRERKADTRRKILLGTLIMEMSLKGDLDQVQITAWLDKGLTRPADRELFNLSLTESHDSTTPQPDSES